MKNYDLSFILKLRLFFTRLTKLQKSNLEKYKNTFYYRYNEDIRGWVIKNKYADGDGGFLYVTFDHAKSEDEVRNIINEALRKNKIGYKLLKIKGVREALDK